MAFNETLCNQVRIALEDQEILEEKLMFGGICFMVNEKMCVGVVQDELMCRIDPALEHEALERAGCRPMDFTGKSMKGFVFIDEYGWKRPSDFEYWIRLCLEFNPKAKKSPKKKKKA